MNKPTLTKHLFFVTNLIYTFFGATLFGIGIWILRETQSFVELTQFGLKFVDEEEVKIDKTVIRYVVSLTKETALLDGLIIIGTSILMIALIGWLGALTDYKSFLVSYCSLIVLMIVIQIGIIEYIMIGYSKNTLLPDKFRAILKQSLKEYLITNTEMKNEELNAMTILWNVIMKTKQCCGVDDHKDFENSMKTCETTTSIPITCCKIIAGDVKLPAYRNHNSCPYIYNVNNSYMEVGCFEKFTELVDVYFVWIRDGFCTTLVLQFICIFLAICIARS